MIADDLLAINDLQDSIKMIPNDARYASHGLIQDMLSVPELIRSFDCDRMQETSREIAAAGRLLLSGEGSSRLFPGKCVIAEARRRNWPLTLHTEAGLQAGVRPA